MRSEATAERISQLHEVAARARPVALAREHVLPVLEPLRTLLPDGLWRGSTVAVHGAAALLTALLAEATAAGSWAAVVGLPSLGLAAAAESGVDLGRLALVPRPGADFPAVVAALLDGVDIVAVHSDTVQPAVARQLSARARHRGAVLVSSGPWPSADIVLSCRPGEWTGLESGAGHLAERRVVVQARGRGAAVRPVSAELLLPGPSGSVSLATANTDDTEAEAAG